jgi:hypothetical protein
VAGSRGAAGSTVALPSDAMTRSLSRRFQDAFIGIFGLAVLAAGIAAIDDTCRRYIVDVFRGDLPAVVPGVRVHAIVANVSDFLPAGNPSLLVFGAAAVVLGVVMFKS